MNVFDDSFPFYSSFRMLNGGTCMCLSNSLREAWYQTHSKAVTSVKGMSYFFNLLKINISDKICRGSKLLNSITYIVRMEHNNGY